MESLCFHHFRVTQTRREQLFGSFSLEIRFSWRVAHTNTAKLNLRQLCHPASQRFWKLHQNWLLTDWDDLDISVVLVTTSTYWGVTCGSRTLPISSSVYQSLLYPPPQRPLPPTPLRPLIPSLIRCRWAQWDIWFSVQETHVYSCVSLPQTAGVELQYTFNHAFVYVIKIKKEKKETTQLTGERAVLFSAADRSDISSVM